MAQNPQVFEHAAVRRWRVHLGAHKTASSHLQEVLALLRQGQLRKGVDILPHRALRESGFAASLVRRRPRLVTRLPLPVLHGIEMRGAVQRHISPLRSGPETIVLSEEKLLGDTRHIFNDLPYPNIETVLPLLATLGQRTDLTLFLSIRAPDRHLPSAYVQELRFRPPSPGGFEAIKRRVLARPPSWHDMIRRIRAAAPGVTLKVWRHEDYRANIQSILSLLCDADVGPVPVVEDPFWTASPGIEAIREAENLPTDLSPAMRRTRVLEIWQGASPDSPRFQPFTPEESARLREFYAADQARIRALDPTMLLNF